MVTKKQSKGICIYCGRQIAKGGMTRHLGSCQHRQKVIAKAEKKKAASKMLYHLRVQDAYNSEFWLDVEMSNSTTLKSLDNYLRSIWLECCGHMSQFYFGGSFGREVGMRRKISDVFQGKEVVTHVYDFGTSSETQIKLVSTRAGTPVTSHPIALMARNIMPEMECIECGQPATHLCLECMYEEETPGTLCDVHVESHPHNDYGEPMLLVNSPRTGMCGYEGPAEPPY